MRPNEIKTERRLVDTMSETSETTTTTTTTTTSGKSGFDNRQELSDIAALLGIENIDDVHQERFRIDRKKLELMLLGDINAGEKAETFFQKVMEATNTYVTWPSRLKIGAKSKKDPHIKVAGRLDDIRLAKEKIIQILDTRQNNRVTMKLDVSYTDHSHIIGKGGLTIKKVMEETGCHIHFPDSNRSNHQEKSNQVSIAGDMEGVEKARARVRKLTPLIFSFELPVMGNNSHLPGHSSPFSTSPYVVKIQEQYNVQVMFRTRPKLHATLVVVKGCEWEVSQVKEATVLLIHYMCENLASQIQVQMSMEISPQHHSIVLGKQSNNLKNIMQRTGTQIMFPDAGDPNIPSLKKSNVTITGSIFNVYLARQQLMGSLPLVLMFDLPEENMSSVNTENISRLMQSLDIFINVRHKPKQSTLSIVIKGIERNATNIYEARKQLLGLTEPIIIADIPPTYHIPNTNNFINQNSCPSFGPIGVNENSMNNRINISAPINITPPTSYCNLSPTPGAFSTNSSSMSYPPQWAITQLPPSLFSPISMNPNHLNAGFNYSSHLNQLLTAQQQQQQIFHNSNKSFGSSGNIQSNSNSLNNTLNSSILSSMRSGAYDSKDSAYSSISSATSSLSSPAMSPRNASPIDPSSTTEGNSNLDLSNVLSDFAHNNIVRSTSMDKKSRPELSYSLQDFNTMTLEYEQKKLLAMKAMQTKPNANDYRVPTTAWSGYGFSHTLPTIPNINDSQMQNPLTQTPDLWKESSVSTSLNKPDYGVTSSKDESSNAKIRGLASNYLENQSNIQMRKITSLHHADLESMLTSVGLEKYIRLFTSHEVDMATFPSLTEKDLCEIGISAWGARRKIMLLISEMNKRTSAFSGSAAPGAERKNSLYNTGTSAAAATSTSSPPPRKSSLESSW